MLFLPLEEDSWLFRLCLYYGLLVLLLELLVPLVFHRRVRVEIPRVALRGPAVPLSTREFVQRRRALQLQLAALQRALAETPRHSPQKRKQLIIDASAARDRPDVSPSPLASPTSSVKVSRLESSRESSGDKRRIERRLERKAGREEHRDGDEARQRREGKVVGREQVQASRQDPKALNNSSATRPVRNGGFSFDEAASEEEKGGEIKASRNEPVGWEQVARRRESPTFSGRRPVRLVADDVVPVRYNGPSEAASRLEALIRARRRRASTTPVYAPPPSQPPATAAVSSPSPSPPLDEVPVSGGEEPLGRGASATPNPVPEAISSPLGHEDEGQAVEDEEETKDSEPLSDFQAFCASFATGGSAAAQKALAKRKHHEAFGSEDEEATSAAGVAQQSVEARKHPRVVEEEEQVDDEVTVVEPHSAEKRTHHEAFGSDDDGAADDTVEAEQVPEKRTHDEAFEVEEKLERPQEEKTPRIARRISFTDEVDALAAVSPKEVRGQRSNSKRKHQQAFGMIDEEDEDAEWRESLAFRPHRSG